ncbi:MAG: hypothetical protein IKB34_00640 [Clostridia bacterium]|nr:hypothetical protein [Clostridia bacterium]
MRASKLQSIGTVPFVFSAEAGAQKATNDKRETASSGTKSAKQRNKISKAAEQNQQSSGTKSAKQRNKISKALDF